MTATSKAGRDILGVGVHDWFIPRSIGYECCRKCGLVRRADDKNNPCRGRVVLSLRDEYTEGLFEMTPERIEDTAP